MIQHMKIPIFNTFYQKKKKIKKKKLNDFKKLNNLNLKNVD